MSDSEIKLYVRSVKTVSGAAETEHEISGRSVLDNPSRVKVEGKAGDGTLRIRQFAVDEKVTYEYVLPDDQKRASDTVLAVARKFHLAVEVIDLTKENVFRRKMQQMRARIKVFPTLILGSGERLEGNIKEQEVNSVLSRIARVRAERL